MDQADINELFERVGGLEAAVGLLAGVLHQLSPPLLQAARRELERRLQTVVAASDGPAFRQARSQLLLAKVLLDPS